MGAPILTIQILKCSQWFVDLFAACCFHTEATMLMFILRHEINTGEHSDLLVLLSSHQHSLLSTKKFTTGTPTSS
jgi:hypothetical protein